jgi:hypothetical protein
MRYALGLLADVMIPEEVVTSYVEGLIESTRALEGLPEQMRFHLDYAGLARDMQYDGEAPVLHYSSTTYTVSGY